MQKWEYQTAYLDSKEMGGFMQKKRRSWGVLVQKDVFVAEDDYLAEMGQKGWELVGVAVLDQAYGNTPGTNYNYPGHTLYFKRPLD